MADHRGVSPMRHTGNIAENWQMWRKRFENYLKASEINKKPESVQCAQLLHYIGSKGFEIYNTFTIVDDEKDKLEVLLNRFEAHFLPKANVTYERYQFMSKRQQQNQSLEDFITELRKQAQKCTFGILEESLVKCMITCGVRDNRIREKLLQDDTMTLEQAINQCKIMELAKEQTKEMNPKAEQEDVDAVGMARRPPSRQGDKGKNKNVKDTKYIENCKKCGKNHVSNNCPAWGKTCNACKKQNHYAAFCISKKTQTQGNDKRISRRVNEVTEEDDFLVINSIEENNNTPWFTNLKINKRLFRLKVDTGAMCNIMSVYDLKKLGLLSKKLNKTSTKLRSYTGNEIQIKGTCEISCMKDDNQYNIPFFITNTDLQPILGLKSSVDLNLVSRIDTVSTEQEITTQYKDVFQGIGCLSKPYHIQLKENAKPVIHATRRIPIRLLDELQESLDKLVKQQIIQKVEGPSEWVNPLVIAKKPNGDLRICLDPKDLNDNIRREFCQIPTLDEIATKMA